MKRKATRIEEAIDELDTADKAYTGHRVKLSRRPERETVIGKEDILNLRIALETFKTWEEFFSLV